MFYTLILLDLIFFYLFVYLLFYVFILLYDCLFSSLSTYSFLCIILFIYIYSFIFLFIYLLSFYFTFIRYWFWCFVWFVSLLQVGFGLCCLFPSVSFFRSFLFCFGKSGEADRCCQGWLFDFCLCLRLPFPVWELSCSLFFCEYSVLFCICLVFRLLWFIWSGVLPSIPCPAVSLLHPWGSVSGVCRWSGVLWHCCKLCLGNCQLKRWCLASVLFWYFPSPFMFFFLLIFYFDILIYKNRYYLLADVYLLSSCFFWMPVESFCFVFSFFNLEGSSVFLYGFSLCFLCLLCVCVPDGISQSFRSSLVQIHFDVFIFRCFEAENMFLLCLFFSICASFAWVGGWFVPDIVWLLFT